MPIPSSPPPKVGSPQAQEPSDTRLDLQWLGDPLLGAVSQHLALAAAGTAFVGAAIVVLSAARFSTTTALAILQAAGPTGVLGGLFVVNLSTIACLAAFGLLAQGLLQVRDGKPAGFTTTTALIVALLAFAVTPLIVLLLYIAVFTWITFSYVREHRAWTRARERGEKREAPEPFFEQLLKLVVALILVGVVSIRLWLPIEDLQLTNGGHVVGYVLAQDNGWTSVLVEDSRIVIRFQTSELDARTVCSTGESVPLTIFQLIRPPPTLPLCSGS